MPDRDEQIQEFELSFDRFKTNLLDRLRSGAIRVDELAELKAFIDHENAVMELGADVRKIVHGGAKRRQDNDLAALGAEIAKMVNGG